MKTSALLSQYIIDGQKQGPVPAQMLQECILPQMSVDQTQQWDTIVDETIDPSPSPLKLDPSKVEKYTKDIEKTLLAGKSFPVSFAEAETKGIVCTSLINAIWKKGHFSLRNLQVHPSWQWDKGPIGNMAAFYHSVEALSDYLNQIDVRISEYDFTDGKECHLRIETSLQNEEECPGLFDSSLEDYSFDSISQRDHQIYLSEEKAIPEKFIPNESDWIVYVPFDTCDFRLGGSTLLQSQGLSSFSCSNPMDPDYFIDCYEIIREMVEDNVAIAGTTVCQGGLAEALQRMSSGGVGANINISGIKKAYQEKDILNILFAEVPGVIIQIRDIDYDYTDAEMLLQDIAWFPIGHPDKISHRIKFECSETGLSSILDSLLSSQTPEGED